MTLRLAAAFLTLRLAAAGLHHLLLRPLNLPADVRALLLIPALAANLSTGTVALDLIAFHLPVGPPLGVAASTAALCPLRSIAALRHLARPTAPGGLRPRPASALSHATGTPAALSLLTRSATTLRLLALSATALCLLARTATAATGLLTAAAAAAPRLRAAAAAAAALFRLC